MEKGTTVKKSQQFFLLLVFSDTLSACHLFDNVRSRYGFLLLPFPTTIDLPIDFFGLFSLDFDF